MSESPQPAMDPPVGAATPAPRPPAPSPPPEEPPPEPSLDAAVEGALAQAATLRTTDPVEPEPTPEPAAPAHAHAAESDADFAPADELLEQLNDEAAAPPPDSSPEPASTDTVADLDAQLAAQGRATLHAEALAEGDPPPTTVSAPVPEDPPAPPPPSLSQSEAPRPESHPQSTAPGDAPAAPASTATDSARPRPKPLAQAARLASAALLPLAAAYARLGDAPRKIIRYSACGTLVQAAALWGWILFIRSPELPPEPTPAHETTSADHKAHAKPAHAPKAKAKPAADSHSGGHGSPKKGH